MTKKKFTVLVLLSALSLLAFAQESNDNARDASSLDQTDPSLIGVESAEQRLKEALNQYHNHNLSVVEILDELFKMSQDFQARLALGEKLGLKKEELTFYEALAQNQSARELMGDEVLSKLAKEITDTLKRSVTIDWQYKEGVRARMRILVKRALQRYKYPPDKPMDIHLLIKLIF